MYHDLHHEVENKELLQFVIDWLKNHVKKGKKVRRG